LTAEQVCTCVIKDSDDESDASDIDVQVNICDFGRLFSSTIIVVIVVRVASWDRPLLCKHVPSIPHSCYYIVVVFVGIVTSKAVPLFTCCFNQGCLPLGLWGSADS